MGTWIGWKGKAFAEPESTPVPDEPEMFELLPLLRCVTSLRTLPLVPLESPFVAGWPAYVSAASVPNAPVATNPATAVPTVQARILSTARSRARLLRGRVAAFMTAECNRLPFEMMTPWRLGRDEKRFRPHRRRRPYSDLHGAGTFLVTFSPNSPSGTETLTGFVVLA
jgi:hypothetical protein